MTENSLSVIIPARNEIYLEKTIKNLLENIRGNTDIYAMLDGYIPDPQIVTNDDRVHFIHHPEAKGQRQSINEAARITTAKYIMKLDAHCAVDEGFDVKLMENCEYDWTVIPTMYNLDVDTWKPKLHKRTQYMYMGMNEKNELRALYYSGSEWKKWHKRPDMIDDTMCCMGPGWFLNRERFWELDGCDETHGSWGQQGVEVACKAWLSGGRLVVNKNTWFAHWFRGHIGFPYHITGHEVAVARRYSKDLWLNDKWPKAKRKFQWLIDKFEPPTWNINNNINKLEGIYKDKVCYIIGDGKSKEFLDESYFDSDSPIITINMALDRVEELDLKNPIYSMQKDKGLLKPKKATLLLHEYESKEDFPDYKPKYIFDRKTLLPEGTHVKYSFSAICALQVAKLFGCNKFKLICFDSCTNGYIDAKDRKHYHMYERQCIRMKDFIKNNNMEVEWITPSPKSMIVTQEMIDSYHQFFYNYIHLKRREPRWRGVKLIKLPSDLILYSEVIWEKKPDFIIDIGTAYGGSALFYADMMGLYANESLDKYSGKARVISIDPTPRGELPSHPRITYIKGDSKDDSVINQIKEMVGTGSVMVVIDGDHSRVQVKWELEKYRHIVTPGQYMVVEDCYDRNSKPYGPKEALDWFLRSKKGFTHTDIDKQFLIGMTRDSWLLKNE